MEKIFLEKLEFNIVCKKLEEFAKTYIGRDICLNLMPLESKKDIIKALKHTTEASTLIYRKGNIPLDEIENIFIMGSGTNHFLTFKRRENKWFLTEIDYSVL